MTDQDAMLAIQQEMDGVEWNTQTLDRIAAILIHAGYRVRDLDDVDFDADELDYATS